MKRMRKASVKGIWLLPLLNSQRLVETYKYGTDLITFEQQGHGSVEQYFTPTPAAWSDCRQSQVNNIFKSALFPFHDVFCFLFSHILVFVYLYIFVLLLNVMNKPVL